MTFQSKKKKVACASRSLSRSLETLSPGSKVSAVAKTCAETLSPASRDNLASSINESSLIDFTSSISKRRDKTSNCARRLALGFLVTKAGGDFNKVRRLHRHLHLKYKSVKNASEKDISSTLKHYKTIKTGVPKEPTETVKLVTEFYNKDTISRQLPYKNLTRIVKDHLGNLCRVPVRVMEVTLKGAFRTFKEANPAIKIGQRSFENLRPKYIRLRRYAQRLQCCCTYHTNMNYVRKAVNKLFLKNEKPAPFPDNDAVISATLCEVNSLKCIMRLCSACKSFPKIDALKITDLKCSASCFKDDKDCSDHTVLLHQFDRVAYMHQGKEKKKLKLLDRVIKLSILVQLFKEKMLTFPLYSINVTQTAKTFDQLISNLDESSILKVHDFLP